MRVQIEQQNNDWVIVIPETLAEQLGLHVDDEVELSISSGTLTIALPQANRPQDHNDDFPVHP